MAHVLAAPRRKVSDVRQRLPIKYFEAMEQNQMLALCCRHPENHEIEAWYSKEGEPVPDIYKFHCSCGKVHTRFCVGGGDIRPIWS
jgi:hypothetical protein